MIKSSHQPNMNIWGFHATIKKQIITHETNMLLHNIQENDNNFGNMEFHTTFKNKLL